MENSLRLNRLNHLVEVMQAVPPKKFFMGAWMDPDFFNKPTRVEAPDTFIKVSCTTAACALGWAAMDRQFMLAGLSVVEQSDCGEVRLDSREDLSDGEVGMEFFGLNEDEVDDLFDPDGYDLYTLDVKPRHVISKIKRLIKKYSKPATSGR